MLQHDISQTHNFKLDARAVDEYLSNILDVASIGKSGKGKPVVEKSSAVNAK